MSNDWSWLYEATRAVAEKIETVSWEELNEYLEMREQVMSRLQEQQAVPSEETKRFFDLSKFNEWDQLLVTKLGAMSEEARNEFSKMTALKQKKSLYERHSTYTSYFFDTKK